MKDMILGIIKKINKSIVKEKCEHDINLPARIYGLKITEQRDNVVKRHNNAVDIIIYVHNALEDIRRCLESVLANTCQPYSLIIVYDGSEVDTNVFLSEFMKCQPGVLIQNKVAAGYTKAVNLGLNASTGEFVVLLNSDTIVTPLWLDRLVECAQSKKEIGVVGPLSNRASWQSVPHVFDTDGDWTDNLLPDGWPVNKFANEVAVVSSRTYPEVGFINGFCFLIKRVLIDKVGIFDEITFSKEYGGENDFCMRAVAAGWTIAIADDCYVYHAQSKIDSHDKRFCLSEKSWGLLAAKHGQAVLDTLLSKSQHHPLLEFIRKRCENIPELKSYRDNSIRQFAGKRVLFLLAACQAGGGGNIILMEAAAMREMGIDARTANLAQNRPYFEANHPENQVPVIYLSDPDDLINYADDFDAIIATLYLTVFWLKPLLSLPKRPIFGYYMQDYEPDFFPKTSTDYKIAKSSYSLSHQLHIFTKTQWNCNKLIEETGIKSSVIGISFDVDNFHPSSNFSENNVLRIIAMVRPTTPRRAPEMTMKVLQRIKLKFTNNVDIVVFGVNDNDPGYLSLDRNFDHRCVGELNAAEVSELIRSADIFVDCSTFQAMGLTSMEAMASNTCVVGPIHGGLKEIIQNKFDGLLVDTTDENAIVDAVSILINDENIRNALRHNALRIVRHSPVIAAANILKVLFDNKGADKVSCLSRKISLLRKKILFGKFKFI